MNARKSSFERLRSLPAVFSVADLHVQGLGEKAATVYLNRWKVGGMVERFGDGVYFNLVADPKAGRRVAEAFDKMLRMPVLRVGPAVLHDAGWTSQVHVGQDFVSPVFRGRLTLPSTDGDVRLSPRYMPWFEILRASASGDLADGIPSVSPAMALADALLSGGEAIARKRPVHAVPPDELDMEGFTQDRLDEVGEALRALGADDGAVQTLLAPYEGAVRDVGSTVQW